jgi:TonB-linked SusC/RagA family outer membrane protein
LYASTPTPTPTYQRLTRALVRASDNVQGGRRMQVHWFRKARIYLPSTLAALFALSAFAGTAHAQGSTISGRVTAAGTDEPLSGTRVMLVGTAVATATGGDGRYVLRNVPSGAVEVRVIRVGYTEMKKAATVVAGQTVSLDFVMTQAVLQLSEIVTTATGQQRRVELGNAVSTLGDVDQKVNTTPVNSLSDLLVAKSPGVIVLTGGPTGSAPVVRIRGLGSLATTGSGISNAPIYIIDGVRMNAGTIDMQTGGTQGSMLSSMDPNEIEDIEIVKGPSAATLYGTDAANGVIVITTKKGRAGPTRWSWYGEAGNIDDRATYPTEYALWSHNATGTPQRCSLVGWSQGACTPDSLTSFSVDMNPATTVIHLGHRNALGMNLNGGLDQVRFFMSGDLQNEIGPMQMPAFAQKSLLDMGTPLRDEWIHPMAFQSYNLRTNVSATVNPQLDVVVNAGYSNTNQRLPDLDNSIFDVPLFSAVANPGFNHDGLGYSETGTLGEFLNGYGSFSPAQAFQHTHEYGTQRFIGSTNASWRPFAWMSNIGTAGIDLADGVLNSTCRFNECTDNGTNRLGRLTNTQNNLRNVSAKLTSNSNWQARSNMTVTTTFGGDYTNLEQDGVSVTGSQLPPGAQTIGSAAIVTANNTLQTVSKTLGLYAQEQVAVNDRLFMTAAARTDQNNAFGTNFQRVVYPKVSLSWIMSDERFFPKFDWLNQFRLRSAYGASGVSPGGTVGLRTFSASTNNTNQTPGSATGSNIPGLVASALGNPNLKPERSAELEAGFEADVLNRRAHASLTYYSKKTRDALISQQIASSSGASALSVLMNLGSVANSGLELEVNSQLIDRRLFAWDVNVAASHNSNKVLSLGTDASGKPNPTIGVGSSRDSVGLPVNAVFSRPYTYSDANSDGIITPNEVTIDPNYHYVGYSSPRDLFSVTNGFDLFNRKLRLTVLTDYKGGFVLLNAFYSFHSTNAMWYANQVKSTPLWDQARTVAQSNAKNPRTDWGYRESGQYWKLRELSAAWTLPNAVTSGIRAHDSQLVFSARNLHTWTGFTGFDPEANYNTTDTQTTFGGLAPPTYFIVRLNLHY